MSYTDLQSLSAGEFKRLCGVSRETFGKMVEVLRPQLERQGKRGGQNKLSAIGAITGGIRRMARTDLSPY